MSEKLIIRAQDKTIQQIKELKKQFTAPSISDVIRRSIDLYSALTDYTIHGNNIYIEDGWRKLEVILPGLIKA